jgi:hypothetical protein
LSKKQCPAGSLPAGCGRFADADPLEVSEFTTPGDQDEQGRTDLPNALMPEVGELPGRDRHRAGVMTETVGAGARREPGTDADMVQFAHGFSALLATELETK